MFRSMIIYIKDEVSSNAASYMLSCLGFLKKGDYVKRPMMNNYIVTNSYGEYTINGDIPKVCVEVVDLHDLIVMKDNMVRSKIRRFGDVPK